jgi:hypothetical protein
MKSPDGNPNPYVRDSARERSVIARGKGAWFG